VGRFQFRLESFDFRGAAEAAERNRAACRREVLRDLFAETAGGAGDESDFTAQRFFIEL
jgi:hypothetical protein